MNTPRPAAPKPNDPHQEDLIDESIDESFPASDPPAVGRKPDKTPAMPPAPRQPAEGEKQR